VIQDGVSPSLHIEYRNFDLKQCFKEGRALRTEGTFRNPKDFNVNKGLSNFGYLQEIGRHINRRLLNSTNSFRQHSLPENKRRRHSEKKVSKKMSRLSRSRSGQTTRGSGQGRMRA
jgi:hypothetical protein